MINKELFEKLLPVLFSGVIAVLLFVVGRIIDIRLKKKETRRNWYQKVIIDPNISKINTFYDSVFTQAETSFNNLSQAISNMSARDYYKAKVQEINQIKELKKQFEYEFINLVSTNFPEIAEELAEHFRDMEDIVTELFDEQELIESKLISMKQKLNSTKYNVYIILYKPFTFQRVKLRKLFSKIFKRTKTN